MGIGRHLALSLCAGFLLSCGGGPSEPSGAARLTIAIAGLPAGVPARVLVSGPGGFQDTVSNSTALRRLEAGTYHFAARYVNAQGQTWLAQLSADSLTLGDRDSATVSVTYVGGAAATLDLSVADAELVQSTQRPDGSVPMVAQRSALLRIHVVASEANTAQPGVRVRLYQGGVAIDSIEVAAPSTSVPSSIVRSPLTSTWNALIPAGRLVAGLEYDVQVDPDDGIPESDKGNNH